MLGCGNSSLWRLTVLVLVPGWAFFFIWIHFILINIKLNFTVTHLLFTYMFQKLSVFQWQDQKFE